LSSPADLGALPDERTLISHIRRRLPPAPAGLRVGPGDDAAVVVPERGAFQVLTTDTLVEGVHFDRRWSTLADVGFKSLAVNLSDLAAMGAAPSLALLSLVLPAQTTLGDLDALLDGFLELAEQEGVTLAGGNLAQSPGPLMVDVTAVGYVRPRRILTRSGGRPGDALYLTGTIGAAAAGLAALQAGGELAPTLEDCVRRHRRPEPRTRIGALLGRNRAASACMDLSDGLADAVSQIAEASGTGAVIDAAALPIDPGARVWFDAQGRDTVANVVAGGDDFELLFAVPRKFRGRLRGVQRETRAVALTRIGELTADPGVRLVRDGTDLPMPRGFSHF
jgi:thiamine-monophosphate kinase